MDRLPYRSAPRWWAPNLRPPFVRALRPYRIWRHQKRQQRVVDVKVRGLAHLRGALTNGCGALIACKHVGHADAFVMLAAGDELGVPFYYLVGWQVFELLSPFSRWVLRRHGAFSIDRESFDLKAFRKAVELLRTSRHPLVVFAEGEVYHHAERVFPFRPGVAAIALKAASQSNRPIVAVPTAIKYEYVDDIAPRLAEVMTALEQHLLWQPRPHLALSERLHRLAHGVLAMREMDHLGEVRTGSYATRLAELCDTILERLEKRYGTRVRDEDVPSRVTHLRQLLIQQMEALPPADARRGEYERELEQLNVVIQLYSYQHDFDTDNASLERQAEMVDKYEEDVLGLPTARIRGARRAIVAFSEPIVVAKPVTRKADPRPLTEQLEGRVQKLLDELHNKQPATKGSGVRNQQFLISDS